MAQSLKRLSPEMEGFNDNIYKLKICLSVDCYISMDDLIREKTKKFTTCPNNYCGRVIRFANNAFNSILYVFDNEDNYSIISKHYFLISINER